MKRFTMIIFIVLTLIGCSDKSNNSGSVVAKSCSADADCPLGNYCETMMVSPSCQTLDINNPDACIVDSQCGEGMKCYPNRVCVKPSSEEKICSVNKDCWEFVDADGKPTVCVNQKCASVICSASKDCPFGTGCPAESYAYRSRGIGEAQCQMLDPDKYPDSLDHCFADEQCNNGLICSNPGWGSDGGQCISPKSCSVTCALYDVCNPATGACVSSNNECSSDTQCTASSKYGDSYTCVNNTCQKQAKCSSDADCENGLICISNGMCIEKLKDLVASVPLSPTINIKSVKFDVRLTWSKGSASLPAYGYEIRCSPIACVSNVESHFVTISGDVASVTETVKVAPAHPSLITPENSEKLSAVTTIELKNPGHCMLTTPDTDMCPAPSVCNYAIGKKTVYQCLGNVCMPALINCGM